MFNTEDEDNDGKTIRLMVDPKQINHEPDEPSYTREEQELVDLKSGFWAAIKRNYSEHISGETTLLRWQVKMLIQRLNQVNDELDILKYGMKELPVKEYRPDW